MTRDEFRRMALGYPEAAEASDERGVFFQVRGKAFATLFPRDQRWVDVMLTSEDARLVSAAEPELFVPQRGGWFRPGFTRINLVKAGEHTVRSALDAAFRNVAPRRLAARLR